MAGQDTKVTYTAVAKFKELHGEIDALLTKIQALEKAEKSLGDLKSKKKGSTSGTSSSPQAEKAHQKQLDKNKTDAANRRNEKANRVTRAEIAAENQKTKAAERRAARALQVIAAQDNVLSAEKQTLVERERVSKSEARSKAVQLKGEERALRNRERADARRTKLNDANNKIAVARAEGEAARVKASIADSIAQEKALNKSLANQKANDDRVRHLNALTDAKIEANEKLTAQRALDAAMLKDASDFSREQSQRRAFEHRTEIKNLNDQHNERIKKDKERASKLARALMEARAVLDTSNSQAAAGNRFTRNKVAEKNVGSVAVNYDRDRDVTYWEAVNRAREQELRLIQRATGDINREINSRGRLNAILSRIPGLANKAGTSTSRSFRGANGDINKTNTLLGGFTKRLDKLGRWRPRLIPPFIVLVPLIASLLALINPLAAGIGALGVAALGLGGSLFSLAGAAIAVVPALSALLAVGGALFFRFG